MSEPVRVLGLAVESAGAIGPTKAIQEALNHVGGAAALAQSALGIFGSKGAESITKLAGTTPLIGLQTHAMAASGHAAYDAATAQREAAAAAEVSARAAATSAASWAALAIAGAALVAVLHKVVEESIEAQNADSLLAASLRASGATSGRTAQQIDELANSIEDLSTFSDEAAKRAAAMLFVFDKVRGDTFDRTLLAATDLAAFMGSDLPSAAQMLGRALQDPEHGLMMLQRQLRLFSEEEEKSIKQMAQMGNIAGAQARILAELESKVKGTASTMQNNLGGSLKHLTNEFGNLFEVTQERSGFIIRAINGIANAISRIPKGSFGDIARGYVIGGPAFGQAVGRAGAAAISPPAAQPDQAFAEAQRRVHAASVANFAALEDERRAREALNKTVREATVGEEGELAKLRALNAAYGQSEVQLAIIGVRQDARIKTLQAEASGALPQVIARQVQLIALMADEQIRAIKLAEAARQLAIARQHENDVIEVRLQLFADIKRAQEAAGVQGQGVWQTAKDAIAGFQGNPVDTIRRSMLEAKKVAVDTAMGMGKEMSAAIWDERIWQYDAAKAGHDLSEALNESIQAGMAKVEIPLDPALMEAERKAQEFGERLTNAFQTMFSNIAARGKASLGDLFNLGASLAPGPIGGFFAIGAVIADSIAGDNKRMQEEVAHFNEARQQWIDALRQFVDDFSDPLDDFNARAREAAERRAELLASENTRYGDGGKGLTYTADQAQAAHQERLAAVNEEYRRAIEYLERMRERMREAFSSDLRIDTLRAQGHDYEADILALQNEFAAKIAEAGRLGLGQEGYDAVNEWFDAMVKSINAAHALAEAEKALAIQRQTDSLQAQVYRLQGNEAAALHIERQLQLEQASNDAQRALLELIFGLQDSARAAEEAAAAQQAHNAAMVQAAALSTTLAEQLATEEGRTDDAARIALDEWYNNLLKQIDLTTAAGQAQLAQLNALYNIKAGKIGAPTDGGAGASGGGAGERSINAFDNIGAEKGDILVDLTRSHLSVHRTTNMILWMIERNTRGGGNTLDQLNSDLRGQNHSRDVDN